MKRKTLYNFNSVQLTFNQCVFNRIQYSVYKMEVERVVKLNWTQSTDAIRQGV